MQRQKPCSAKPEVHIQVKYHTVNASALAGREYEACSGSRRAQALSVQFPIIIIIIIITSYEKDTSAYGRKGDIGSDAIQLRRSGLFERVWLKLLEND